MTLSNPIKTFPNGTLLFNELNNSFSEQNMYPENVKNSRYFNADQLQSLKFSLKKNFPSFFHSNACSLNKIFDDFVYLLKPTNKIFDVIYLFLYRDSFCNYIPYFSSERLN